jgi:hypothetical protein
LIAATPAAAQEVLAADGDWSNIPQVTTMGNHWMSSKAIGQAEELLGRGGRCASATGSRVEAAVPFLLEFDPADKKVSRIVVRKTGCPGLEAIVGGEIVRADEESVDARKAEDFISVFDGLFGFEHDDDEDFVVSAGVVSGGIGFKIRGVLLATDGTLAERRVTGGCDDGFGFGACVHHGNDDAVSAGIEDAFDVFGCVPGNTRKGDFAAGGDDGEASGGSFEGSGGVFEIDGEPIERGAGHKRGGGGAGKREPGADARLAALEFVADVIRAHKLFELSAEGWRVVDIWIDHPAGFLAAH